MGRIGFGTWHKNISAAVPRWQGCCHWQVVDWYHAKQHLHQVADLAFGEGNATGQQWVKSLRTPLYQGQVWQVSADIQDLAVEYPSAAKSLLTEANYFESNQRRMQ